MNSDWIINMLVQYVVILKLPVIMPLKTNILASVTKKVK